MGVRMAKQLVQEIENTIKSLKEEMRRIRDNINDKQDYIDDLQGEIGTLEEDYSELEEEIKETESDSERELIVVTVEFSDLTGGLWEYMGYNIVRNPYEIRIYTGEDYSFLVLMDRGSVYGGREPFPQPDSLLEFIPDAHVGDHEDEDI